MKPEKLINHPEGGRYREVFRSVKKVTTESGSSRTALTHIYFSLESGEVSKFHRVTSDEVWNLYQGALRLCVWKEGEAKPEYIELSEQEGQYCYVVPAGVWQAAEPISGSVLVGCSVGPGFDFEDFQLIDPVSKTALELEGLSGEYSKFIH